jgi:hypothetical protein
VSGELIQTLLVGSIILAAAAYVGRRWWKTLALARTPKRDGGSACGPGCGCSPE